MKAYVTSLGETTTDLCVWSLERNGFEVVLIKDNTTLGEKLGVIYSLADDDFIRVDADVVVNKDLNPQIGMLAPSHVWWLQFRTFDWFKQGPMNGGVQFIKKEALPALRENIGQYKNFERPETQMYRLKEFVNPRRCESSEFIMGLHGYKQSDIQRVKDTKERRNQLRYYDFELAERLDQL